MRLKPALIAIVVLACASVASIAAETISISQRNHQFAPTTLTIAPGTIITIMNDDRVSHHVNIDQPDMKFDSGEQKVGHDVTLRFDREGRFAVRCAIHPTMRLDIAVEAPKAH